MVVEFDVCFFVRNLFLFVSAIMILLSHVFISKCIEEVCREKLFQFDRSVLNLFPSLPFLAGSPSPLQEHC